MASAICVGTRGSNIIAAPAATSGSAVVLLHATGTPAAMASITVSGCTSVTDAVTKVIGDAGLTINDVDLIIPHQANDRIIDLAVRRLGISRDKVMVNLDRYGNTSAASIPLALCEALDAGLVQPGSRTVLVAFGAKTGELNSGWRVLGRMEDVESWKPETYPGLKRRAMRHARITIPR